MSWDVATPAPPAHRAWALSPSTAAPEPEHRPWGLPGQQVEHTATTEHGNKRVLGAQESKRQVCKGIRGTKDADQDFGSAAAASCLCAQGPGKSPLHPHFGYLNTFKVCSR